MKKTMTKSRGWCRSHLRRFGTTESMTTNSNRKAVQVIQLRAMAIPSSSPPGSDSVIATVGKVSAAAISIGVFSRSATRVLRASIPGSKWACGSAFGAHRD